MTGRHTDLATALVAWPRTLHAQLPLGQCDHAGLAAAPGHRPAGAATLPGARQILRRTSTSNCSISATAVWRIKSSTLALMFACAPSSNSAIGSSPCTLPARTRLI